MAFADDIENIVVQYLHSARPCLGSERIEAALRYYIDQLDDEARSRILPGWKKPGGKGRKTCKPPIEELDDIERDALAVLNQKQRQRALYNEELKSTVDREAVLGAVAALRDGLSWNVKNKIEDLWAAEESVITSDRFKRSSPAERLTMLYESSISTAYWSEYKRRITALLIQHERKQGCKSKSNAATEKAQRLRTLAGRSLANAKDLSLTANAWLRFVGVWGLGGLVMPGPGQQRAFEHALSPDHFRDLHEFCRDKLPDITTRVHQTHETVRNLLIRAIQICEGDEETLWSGQGRLANAYRTRWEDYDEETPATLSSLNTTVANAVPLASVQSDTTALETLAEVAHSRQPKDRPRGPQTGGADSGPVSCASGAQNDSLANVPVQIPASDSVLTTNTISACDENTTTGQVQTSAPHEVASLRTAATYGQAVQPRLQSYAEQNYARRTTLDYVRHNDIRSSPPHGSHHASNITVGQGLPSLWCPSVDSERSHETYTGEFTPDLGGTHPSIVDNGHSTPDDWEKIMQELYARFGDGTGYDP